jgi:hypothetical protein
MTYDQWNIDQSDSHDEQQDDMGYGAQLEQADLAGQRQDDTGYDAQASQDPYGTEQPENRADCGDQAARAGYGDEPQMGDVASQWR